MPPSSGPAPWRIEPLGKHDRAAFSCGNDILDRYLREMAGQDARRFVAAPFVAVDPTAPEAVLGYYTLSSFAIDPVDFPRELVRRLPGYAVVPATLLGRLAVDQSRRGQGLGEFLLMDALRRAHVQSAEIASHAVIVDAIDDAASRFYQHFEFIPFPERQDRLFLTMKTIAALF